MATSLGSAFFNNRKRRRTRHSRVGLGFPDPSLLTAAGIGITSPVTVAQGADIVSLLWSFEFFAPPSYPAGTLLDTGELIVALTALGVLTVNVPAIPTNIISVDLSDPTLAGRGTPPNGIHVFVVVCDPVVKSIGLFVDGWQVGSDAGDFVLWADGVATWEFMNTVTDADSIGSLEIFPGVSPSAFRPTLP